MGIIPSSYDSKKRTDKKKGYVEEHPLFNTCWDFQKVTTRDTQESKIMMKYCENLTEQFKGMGIQFPDRNCGRILFSPRMVKNTFPTADCDFHHTSKPYSVRTFVYHVHFLTSVAFREPLNSITWRITDSNKSNRAKDVRKPVKNMNYKIIIHCDSLCRPMTKSSQHLKYFFNSMNPIWMSYRYYIRMVSRII